MVAEPERGVGHDGEVETVLEFIHRQTRKAPDLPLHREKPISEGVDPDRERMADEGGKHHDDDPGPRRDRQFRKVIGCEPQRLVNRQDGGDDQHDRGRNSNDHNDAPARTVLRLTILVPQEFVEIPDLDQNWSGAGLGGLPVSRFTQGRSDLPTVPTSCPLLYDPHEPC